MIRENINRKLKSWGNWAGGRLGTEYPAVSVGMLPLPTIYHIPLINENEALQIEQIVLHLRVQDCSLYDVVMLKYVYKCTVDVICDKLNITKPTYFKRLATAEISVAMILSFIKRKKRVELPLY